MLPAGTAIRPLWALAEDSGDDSGAAACPGLAAPRKIGGCRVYSGGVIQASSTAGCAGPSRETWGRITRSIRLIASSRSEEHTSELQSLMRHSYSVLCLKKKKRTDIGKGT